MTSFDDAFDALLGNEGGYTVDDGGPTCWGITERVARGHEYTGDMRDLPKATAKIIAKSEYWDAVRGDELDPRLAFQVFDAAYNSGATMAIKWLQAAAFVAVDGAFGPATMVAVKSANLDHLIERFDARRLLFMAGLMQWPTYGRGWARRIADNLLRASA